MYIYIYIYIYLSNPKPGHTTGRAGRGGGAEQGGVGRRQVGAPRKQPASLPAKSPKTAVRDLSSEARTNEILCKPSRGTR